MVGVLRRVLVASFALAVLGSGASTAVLADGLPAPLAEATGGPSGASILAITRKYGLACQADQSSVGAAEWACVRPDSSNALILSATFYADPALVMVVFVSGVSPLRAEGREFIRDITAPFCWSSGSARIARFITDGAGSPDPAGTPFDDPSCRLVLGGTVTADQTILVMTAFAKSAAGDSGPPGSSPSPGLPAPGSDSGEGIGQTTFAGAIPDPGSVSKDPIVLGQSAVLAALVVILMPFPAQLFNSTLEEHYDEIRRSLRLDRISGGRGRLQRLWRTPVGIVGFALLSSVLYGLLDPTLAPNLEGAAEVGGLLIGLLIVTLLFAIPALLQQRRAGIGVRLRALPGTLLVGFACVVVSRITNFQPGYMYGAILGLEFARPLAIREAARLNVLAAALSLIAALGAWVGLAMIRAAQPGFGATVIETALAGVLVAALEGVVFGLLPLRFLPGESVFATHRVAWAALLGVGAFAFFHILLNPASGYLADSSRTPLLTIVALLVGFGIISVAFWAYFRFRRSPG